MDKDLKGVYLGCHTARHNEYNIDYNDVNEKVKPDILGDMMEINLTNYDYIIATPPCNWWSKANYRRNSSKYSLETKHLLIDILHKLVEQDKPFIVENVKNKPAFKAHGLFDLNCNVYFIGRHTYWTNITFDSEEIEEMQKNQILDKIVDLSHTKREGGYNVGVVINKFLKKVNNYES